MCYLHLTAEDMKTIEWVGGRYSWSNALWRVCDIGDNEIAEHVAWAIVQQFELDTEGDHSYFPCLDHSSELASKLFAFMDQIV